MTDEEILNKHNDERTICEVWSRVMGYFRPMSQYNIGKKQEFKERKWFTEVSLTKKKHNDIKQTV